MKAIVYHSYGPAEVLKYEEVELPKVSAKDVLIKVQATNVSSGDCEMRRFDIPFFFWIFARLYLGVFGPRKKIMGQELAGIVTKVGRNVSRFKPGDEVFATTKMRLGSYAEYASLPERETMALKPSNMSFEEATTVPVGGLNALHFMRLGKIEKGQQVLIHAATGGIGTYAIQLARYFGGEVTAVCRSKDFGLVRELGATHCIDYMLEDFSENGMKYDVIFDTIGKADFHKSHQSLTDTGRLLLANPSSKDLLRGLVNRFSKGKKIIIAMARETQEELEFLKSLIEAGELRAVIDRVYPLQEMVAVHIYVEQRTKVGHVVVQVAE